MYVLFFFLQKPNYCISTSDNATRLTVIIKKAKVPKFTIWSYIISFDKVQHFCIITYPDGVLDLTC